MFIRQKVFIVILMGMVIALGFMSTDIYLPSLPFMARNFSISDDAIQFSVSLGIFSGALSSFLVGYFADRWGRRPFLLIGCFFFTITSLFSGLGSSFFSFMVCRFFQGISVGILYVLGLTVVQDMFKGVQGVQMLSLVGMACTIGPAFAPVIGGYVHVLYGWHWNFYLLAIAGLLLWSLIFLFCQETAEIQRKSLPSWCDFKQSFRDVIIHKQYVLYASLIPLLFAGEMCYLTTAPFYYIQAKGLSPDIFGLHISFMVLIYSISCLLMVYIVRFFDNRTLVIWGVYISFFAILLQYIMHIFSAESVYSTTMFFTLHQVGLAVLFSPSVTLSMEHINGSVKGMALSIRSAVNTLSGALGAFAASFLSENSFIPSLTFVLLSSIIPILIVHCDKKILSHSPYFCTSRSGLH